MPPRVSAAVATCFRTIRISSLVDVLDGAELSPMHLKQLLPAWQP
jgi:hypothetical protein